MGVVNGVDDLLAAVGPDRVLDLFDAAAQPSERKSQAGLLVELMAQAELFQANHDVLRDDFVFVGLVKRHKFLERLG